MLSRLKYLFFIGLLLPICGQAQQALLQNFQNPPNAARPRVWWHWMNGNITKDGIQKDLE